MALIGLLKIQENEPAITNRQMWLLIATGLACFLTGTSQTFVPALFPLLALSKKQKMWQISGVFVAFQIGRIIVGHFQRKVMSLVTPKFLIITGVILCCGTNILFGCMEWSPGSVSFLALNSFLQLINGMGTAMTFYGVVLIVGSGAFYANSIYFIALMDSFGIAGLVAGAPIATIIYTMSNYFTTFAVLGLAMLMTAIFLTVVVEESGELMEWPSRNDYSIFLGFPLMWLLLGAIAINSAADSYVVITLSEELEERKMGVVSIGGMFLLTYLCTCAADFLSAAIVLRTKSHFLVISFGSLILALGLLCLGPASTFNVNAFGVWGRNRQMGTMALGLVLKGLGTGCVSASAVAGLLRSARLRFPDDLTTFIMVVKVVFASEYIGHLTGSLCTGPLYEMVGHSDTTTFVAMFFAFLLFSFLVAHCVDKRRQNYVTIEGSPSCGCSLNQAEGRGDERAPISLSTSIEPADSGEWNWLYGNNRTVL